MVYTLAPIVIGVTVVVEPKPPPPVEVPPLPDEVPPDVEPKPPLVLPVETLVRYVSETQPSTPESKSTFHQ